jgi:hypothetical protein
MLLYHGTAGLTLGTLTTEGLKPRGNAPGNWQHTSPSHRNAVYLSRCYAPYFMMVAAEKCASRFGAIVEVDSDALLLGLVPDEDAVEQWNRGKDKVRGDIGRRVRYYRDKLHLFNDSASWEQSVASLGNCAHLGPISPGAFTRVALFDMKAHENRLIPLEIDPTITSLNHAILGNNYHALTRWIFGDDPDETDTSDFHSYKIACRSLVYSLRDGTIVGEPREVVRERVPSRTYQALAAEISAEERGKE